MTTECDIWLETRGQFVRIHQLAGQVATAFKCHRPIAPYHGRLVVAVDGKIVSARIVELPDGVPEGENVSFRFTDDT